MTRKCQTDFHPHHAQGGLLFCCCFAATSAATFISRLSSKTLELLSADEQLFYFLVQHAYCKAIISWEITGKKLTSFCYIILPLTVSLLSQGDNNKRFDFHLLYHPFSQRKVNSCYFISELRKGQNLNQVNSNRGGSLLNPG